MNKGQRVALGIGMAVFLTSALYAPWWVDTVLITQELDRIEYGWLFNPPPQYERGPDAVFAWERLAVQWITIVVLTGGVLLLLKEPRTREG